MKNQKEVNKNRKENSKAYNNRLKDLKENVILLSDVLNAEKSLGGSLRRLTQLDKEDNGFNLTTVHRTVISNNAIDLLELRMNKRTLEKQSGTKIAFHIFTSGNSDKQLKKIRALADSTKDVKLVEEKTKEVQQEISDRTGGLIEPDKVPVNVKTEKKIRKKQFTPKELLEALNRIDAEYTAYRIKGMSSNNIEDVYNTMGIFDTTKMKSVA